MGAHVLATLGTASLDSFGGLITFANPEDIPEGGSPRVWDCDFIVGSVFTRPGLNSVYVFTNTLTITGLTITYGVGFFTYTGSKAPVVNEGFVLTGFTNSLNFLNGLTVFVTSVDPGTSTFTADIVSSDIGPLTELDGTAASTTGDFVGPNVGGTATVISSSGNMWSAPGNILGNVGFASAQTGMSLIASAIPGTAGNLTGTPWGTPSNVLTTSASFATAVLTGASSSAAILANNTGFSLPGDATVVGVAVTLKASTNSPAGASSISLQLAQNGSAVGTPVVFPIGSTPTVYTQGSASYQWGTTLTTQLVNGIALGVLIKASLTAAGGTSTIQANSLSVTVYYTTASASEVLHVTTFSFAIPSTSGISGFVTTFQAYSTAVTNVTFQLLKNGVAVGNPHVQVLTTVPTVYSVGEANDLWGDVWSFSDVNSTMFGIQVTASELGTTFINDLDMLVYITPSLTNFNYVKSFVQNDGQIDTLALDASGILWEEDVTNDPGTLYIALTGILPGSFAKSATADDQEYILFSDLTVGTERPRVYNGTQFLPLSQVGPGAPPAFVSSVGTSGQTLGLTNYAVLSDVVTFDYTGLEPTAGQLFTVTGVTPPYLNITGTVLSVPPPSSTQFSMAITHADDPGGAITGTATLTNNYPIQSITQFAAVNGWQELLQSSGPGQTSPGTTLTVYYSQSPDANLVSTFNAGLAPTYVYITGSDLAFGTYVVTSIGYAKPPGSPGAARYFFTANLGSSGYKFEGNGTPGSAPGAFQQTIAKLTVSSPIPNLVQGDTINISNATPTAWDGAWPVVNTVKSGVLNISQTSMDASGNATYSWNLQSGVGPAVGEIVTITNCTNNAIFNTTGVISAVTGGVSAGTFVISGFSSPAIPSAFEADGQAVTFGTQFTIDPGAKALGNNLQSPIYGNDTSTGYVTVVGGSVTPIGAGTRQAVVFFITESGYETQVSPPVTFTTSSEANFITASNIPIGPPNVIARGIAFTEAGQNGVPGANFYVIPDPVSIIVGNTTTTYSSTIIRDNITTSAKFTFTDAVLLDAQEIDVQGNDLFNLIELGSSAWAVPYASRMFYGLQLNKIDNFLNTTFDGGYLPNSGGPIFPLGWNVDPSTVNTTLITSVVTGQSLYVNNPTLATVPVTGLMSQGAYQDAYQVAIIQPNTLYSVRVAARAPSGIGLGTLQLALVDLNPTIGFGRVYGTFSIPLSSMTTNIAVFSGTLLTAPFTTTVSTQLTLQFEVLNLGPGADVEVDRFEVYPTLQPYLKAQVYGSYVDNLEAIDASGSGGIIDTTSENPQDCMGGFVMHDNLYLLKKASMYSTEDNPNSEPGGWGLHEVSNKVGTIGISSYDVGEEWAVTACRSGIYGFNGGQPTKLMQEIWNLWELINWKAGNTIVLRNDLTNRRILCAVPLPTPNAWLPFDPPNPAPTSPNVILMLNYQGLNTFEELVNSPELHTTMFGTLAAVDMKRKWSIWRIPTPYMDFITRQDKESTPLFVCNGINSSKIYQFLDDQLSDDGVAIFGLYTTYGFVNAAKAVTMPIFGMHAKRYTVLQVTTYGAGTEAIRVLPNTLGARYPYTVLGSRDPLNPGAINLTNPAMDDYVRNLNIKGNRVFLEFSTNKVGAWMNISKVLLAGKAESWSNLNPTGGGNIGITSV